MLTLLQDNKLHCNMMKSPETQIKNNVNHFEKYSSVGSLYFMTFNPSTSETIEYLIESVFLHNTDDIINAKKKYW